MTMDNFGADRFRLDDHWAVVTGSSKGIGLGIAQSLLSSGANLLLVARGSDDLRAAAEQLQSRATGGQEVRSVVADTSDPDSVERLFAVAAELPSLDVFVANAGVGRMLPFLEASLEEWRAIIDLNLTGTFMCVQAAARIMVASDRPNRSIIVVSSIRAHGARPGVSVYATTKAGLNQMARVAAYELAPHGVRVNVISPGITATPMAVEGNPDVFANMAATVPLGRAGDVMDMGDAAVYLASPAARFVTGSNLVVDGGEGLW